MGKILEQEGIMNNILVRDYNRIRGIDMSSINAGAKKENKNDQLWDDNFYE